MYIYFSCSGNIEYTGERYEVLAAYPDCACDAIMYIQLFECMNLISLIVILFSSFLLVDVPQCHNII
jgi:hypothetical protein